MSDRVPRRPDDPAGGDPNRPAATWGAGEAIVGALVAYAVAVIVGGVVEVAVRSSLSCGARTVVEGLAVEAAFGAVILLWVRFASRAPLGALGSPREPLRDLATGVVGGALLVVAAYVALILVYLIASTIIGHRPSTPNQVPTCVRGAWLWLTGPVVVAVAPLGEETLFRGFLYQGLRRRLPVWPAALVSGALFGLIHGYAVLIPALFVVGVGLALIFERRRSLLASIAAHATFNLVNFLLIALKR